MARSDHCHAWGFIGKPLPFVDRCHDRPGRSRLRGQLILFHRRVLVSSRTYVHAIQFSQSMPVNKILFSYPTPGNGGTTGRIFPERVGRDHHFVRYALLFVIGYPTPLTLTLVRDRWWGALRIHFIRRSGGPNDKPHSTHAHVTYSRALPPRKSISSLVRAHVRFFTRSRPYSSLTPGSKW